MPHKFPYTLYEAEPKRNLPVAAFHEYQLAAACKRLIEESKMHKYPLFISIRKEKIKEVM